jgi:hypothetical protein
VWRERNNIEHGRQAVCKSVEGAVYVTRSGRKDGILMRRQCYHEWRAKSVCKECGGSGVCERCMSRSCQCKGVEAAFICEQHGRQKRQLSSLKDAVYSILSGMGGRRLLGARSADAEITTTLETWQASTTQCCSI